MRGIARAAAAALPAPPPESGLGNEGLLKGEAGFQPRRPMALPHPEIFGFLSHDQLAQNYQAYRHDFERLVVAERVLATMPRDAAHGNDYGLIRRQQIEAANSVLLHEFYFRNLAVKPMKPSGYVLDNLMSTWARSIAGARTLSSARESRRSGRFSNTIPTTIAGTICRRVRRTQADGREAIR